MTEPVTSATEEVGEGDRARSIGLRFGWEPSGFGGIWVATIMLFGVSWFMAPGTVGSRAVLTMLPFAAILAIAAAGETLVIQQRGIDLSVAGMISLAAVVVTKLPASGDSGLLVAIPVALLLCSALGAVSGAFIAKLGVTPLIATLAMNAIILGMIRSYSGGSPSGALPALADFALASAFGVSNTVPVSIAVVAVLALYGRYSLIGRRFVAIGSNTDAARAAGLRVDAYHIGTYGGAAFCYAIAGILLAGFVKTPGLDVGDSYLFASISAVIIGGTPLTGGKGSVVASAVAALFLSQLVALVLSIGAPTSIQLLVQAVAIAAATIMRDVYRRISGREPPTRPASQTITDDGPRSFST
jgi:ribose transport system permease protein